MLLPIKFSRKNHVGKYYKHCYDFWYSFNFFHNILNNYGKFGKFHNEPWKLVSISYTMVMKRRKHIISLIILLENHLHINNVFRFNVSLNGTRNRGKSVRVNNGFFHFHESSDFFLQFNMYICKQPMFYYLIYNACWISHV